MDKASYPGKRSLHENAASSLAFYSGFTRNVTWRNIQSQLDAAWVASVLGWRVTVNTFSQVRPRGFTARGEFATSSSMGNNTWNVQDEKALPSRYFQDSTVVVAFESWVQLENLTILEPNFNIHIDFSIQKHNRVSKGLRSQQVVFQPQIYCDIDLLYIAS